MKLKLFVSVFYLTLFTALNSSAQIYRSCTSTLEFDKSKDTLADAKAMKTYMIYNSGSGEFIFKMDLSSIETGNTIMDAKFADLEDQFILFKGNYVGQATELVSGMNDEKNRTFAGTLSMNSISQACNIVVQSVNYADKTENKSLKLDIIFVLDPIKLNIPLLKDLTQKPIDVEVNGGYVNLLN
jgi:WD40 repeat protein